MNRQHVITAHVLDMQEFIFRRGFGQGDSLNAVFLAAWAIQKQIAKVAGAFTTFQGFTNFIHIIGFLCSITDIENVPRVRAIEVIFTAEQRRGFIQQNGWDRYLKLCWSTARNIGKYAPRKVTRIVLNYQQKQKNGSRLYLSAMALSPRDKTFALKYTHYAPI
ncbi:hypothetical protein IQ211_13715 [Xenorhabdus griffiniae]|nr:hypothetical protein [Xenorhabdus griffiniae]MBE8588393.1 hypothetical protein [Xenorhabdus griffiniae]